MTRYKRITKIYPHPYPGTKPVPSFPGYYASEEGELFSHRIPEGRKQGFQITRIIDEARVYREPIQNIKFKRYETLTIVIESGEKIWKNVHILIAEAFLGPRPEGLEVCHNDGNRNNNRPDNLRYDTRSSNNLDAYDHGRKPAVGEMLSSSKLQEYYKRGKGTSPHSKETIKKAQEANRKEGGWYNRTESPHSKETIKKAQEVRLQRIRERKETETANSQYLEDLGL